MSRNIVVKGAREHNLKNIDVSLPKEQLVVITGPSGSGKSSLAFDTIFAEGQRRYLDSLSSYARYFLGGLKRPDVDDIEGLSPAISIEQKGTSHNPRSTVGTVTEVADHLRLLFARVGVPKCPSCGKDVRRHTVDEIVDLVISKKSGLRLEILAPMAQNQKGEFKNLFATLRRQGFMRVRVDGQVLWLEEDIVLEKNKKHSIEVVVDRLVADEERRSRIAEAVQTSFGMSGGFVKLVTPDGEEDMTENYGCPDCHISLPPLEPSLFSFNNPQGACPHCHGLGSVERVCEELCIDPSLSIREGALLPLRGRQGLMGRLEALAKAEKYDLTVPFEQMPPAQRHAIWHGHSRMLNLSYKTQSGKSTYSSVYEGLKAWVERQIASESEDWRAEFLQYQIEERCVHCDGTRLRPEARSVFVRGKSMDQLCRMPIDELHRWMVAQLTQSPSELEQTVMCEIEKRLGFLVDVGAGYLTLERRADTLSGGESQRIRLASQIGSKLTGVMYVLDEPTIGLHSRDTERLNRTLEQVRDLGNTVIVVEHDRDTIAKADYIVEIGPQSGANGGHLVACGTAQQMRQTQGLTGPYLRGEVTGCEFPSRTFQPDRHLVIRGAREHNLKNLDLSIPLDGLICLTGVSGSGKSTLLHRILYQGLARHLRKDARYLPGDYDCIEGVEQLNNVILVDQSPIGRTPRSNPATYTGVFSPIRELFASLPEAKLRGFTPGRFSFNTKGGRCEACGGAGEKRVSMLFLPDMSVCCDVCHGTRYNRETLEVKFKGLSIADVLNLTVEDSIQFFADQPSILRKLTTLEQAGLGYMTLGQSALTLSGGEAQRVKLAKELSKRFVGSTLYLLDEPSTGLYYNDVARLLKILHRLVEQGNSLVVIEHNLDILCSADYLIDLGPEGGDGGGTVVWQGTPKEAVQTGVGHTAQALRAYVEELGGWPNERETKSSSVQKGSRTKKNRVSKRSSKN